MAKTRSSTGYFNVGALAIVGIASATMICGCAAHQEAPATTSARSLSLVMPSVQTRRALRLSGLAPAGSDWASFSGRRDPRMGTSPSHERFTGNSVRNIADLQYATHGRPNNAYRSTTRSIVRTER